MNQWAKLGFNFPPYLLLIIWNNSSKVTFKIKVKITCISFYNGFLWKISNRVNNLEGTIWWLQYLCLQTYDLLTKNVANFWRLISKSEWKIQMKNYFYSKLYLILNEQSITWILSGRYCMDIRFQSIQLARWNMILTFWFPCNILPLS